MQQRIDSLAQQVEHNTFNVGVLGSSPRRITQKKAIILKKVIAFFIFVQMVPVLVMPFISSVLSTNVSCLPGFYLLFPVLISIQR